MIMATMTAFRAVSLFATRLPVSRNYFARRSLSRVASSSNSCLLAHGASRPRAASSSKNAKTASTTTTHHHRHQHPPPPPPSSVVSVFDNVLSPACRAELTSDALYDIGPGVYKRVEGAFSPQEVLIESILEGLGDEFDGTREVEWWGRSEYKNVEAHRDVDEEAASVRGERRYPTHSIIVYLDVDEGVRAPTCLWVPADDGDGGARGSALVAVPVVPGRILVLSGEILHAVPCPALRWLVDPLVAAGEVVGYHHPGGRSESGHHPPRRSPAMRRVLVLNLWDDHAPEDEDWMYDDDDNDDEDPDNDGKVDEEGEDVREQGEPIEFFAKRVECRPRRLWRPIALQGPPLPAADEDDNDEGYASAAPSPRRCRLPATTTITLTTRSHGSDEPFLSPLEDATITRSDVARLLLESESTPRWLWTGADVRDLGIGVPSVAGSRVERMED